MIGSALAMILASSAPDGEPGTASAETAPEPSAEPEPEPEPEPEETTNDSEPEPTAQAPNSAETTEETEETEETEDPDEPPDPEAGKTFFVSEGSGAGDPPYYKPEDLKTVRKRHDVTEPNPPTGRTARWRCLIADPTCGISFEINATAAYTARFQQGDVRNNNAHRWHSGRAQYDFWLNLPVLIENRGKEKITKMTFGPKGGVIFGDTGTLWGNAGVAGRYWLGTGKWAPAIEFSSALTFKLGERNTRDLGGGDPKFEMTRGPVGFTADFGFGLGGFGAIVVGGQYDSPLAREDVPEQYRTSAGGAVFVGFRGNILWGGPLAATILTHGLTQRYVDRGF